MERSGKYNLVVGSTRALLTQKFWANVQVPQTEDACWTWTGSTEAGYAALHIPGRRDLKIKGHQLSFFLHEGRWPEPGKLVCHKCNNKECVNPRHLYEGTHATNAQDRLRAQGFEHAAPPAWEQAS